jgi:phosphate-selective porin
MHKIILTLMKPQCNAQTTSLSDESRYAGRILKLLSVLILLLAGIDGYSQNEADTLKEQIKEQEGRINALDERVLLNEGDLGKLTKIKISGYIQAQYEYYQGGLVKPNDPVSTFFVRRARVKFTYEATDGIRFVLQPDFSTGNLSLKDAYAVAYLPKFNSLTLWAGQFNRLNYEVEYSSSQREVLERSRMIRTIYPGEREVGAKLEYKPLEVPIMVQLAILNGNFIKGNELIDVDSRKDVMARATYSFRIPSAGIGIDAGAHGYFGGLMAKNKYVSDYENKMDSADSNVGSYLDKKWGGVELQLFWDVWGGLALKGEYIAGRNAYPGDSKTNPYRTREFAGYYAYLIKNIGIKNQFVTRFDYFDPNTNLAGDEAGKDVNYTTITFAWQFYLNENIRFTLNYGIPRNETNATYPEDIKDNVLGIRMQAKF